MRKAIIDMDYMKRILVVFVAAAWTVAGFPLGAQQVGDDPALEELDELEEDAEIDAFQDWTWKKKKGDAEAATEKAAAAEGARLPAEVSAPGAELDEVPTAPAPKHPLKPMRRPEANRIDPEKYDKLLSENLDLRERSDRLHRELEQLKKDNTRLNVQVKEIETKREDMAAMLQEYRTTGEGTEELDAKLRKIEDDMRRVMAEKQKLAERAAQLEVQLAAVRVADPEVPVEALPATAHVQEDSPLFVQIQRENFELQERNKDLLKRVKEIETAMASDESAQVDETTRILQEQLSAEEEWRAEQEARRLRDGERVSKLATASMRLQAELGGARQTIARQEQELKRRDKQLRVAAEELRRRDWRMDTAGRTIKTLNRAQFEVQKHKDRQLLDTHYNMGVMLTERGRIQEARKAYLRALRINPADPDVNYNLAILYDDYFNDPDKAYVHFERYLQFNPHAPDGDIVRSWLLEIEMAIR